MTATQPQSQDEGSRAPDAPTHSRTLARLVRGKNINEETLLATDYLNHFNEIIMLIEMLPGMPECLEDAREWVPKSYEEHFRDSSFADKDLAILAYLNAPPRFRAPFDATVAQMDALVRDGLAEIESLVAARAAERLEETAGRISRTLQKFVDVASAIIHGDERAMGQDEIDAILNR